ncbi:hypothetical protein ACIPPJ_18130 [Streptomyces sp. NPDC086091]|uniref:hypothetical protein n=1 Tax=Streptomyces sp. NPDC086091 TaxID=3365751 RepID=UPI003808D8C0
MATRTVDDSGAGTAAGTPGADAGAKRDEETVDTTKTDATGTPDATETSAPTDPTETPTAPAGGPTGPSEVTDGAPESADGTDDSATADDDGAEGLSDEDGTVAEGPTGVGQGAAAVVSAALGLVSLTGGWIGTVAAARETLVGQLETSSSASVAQQIQAVYGDAWQTTALWAGLFALAALVTGVVVLARPAFGNPARPQAPWIKSVSWAGVVLGVIGLLLAVLKYTDALIGLPSAP